MPKENPLENSKNPLLPIFDLEKKMYIANENIKTLVELYNSLIDTYSQKEISVEDLKRLQKLDEDIEILQKLIFTFRIEISKKLEKMEREN